MNAQPISYPSSLPRDLPSFDVVAAVERMMGRADLWWRVLTIFLDQFDDWETGWRASQAVQENERKSVHALRSAAANIGAVRLAAAAAALETALQQPDTSQQPLAFLRQQLHECFDEARRAAAQVLSHTPLPANEKP